MSFCIYCGNKIYENDRFCRDCGKRVEYIDSENGPVRVAYPEAEESAPVTEAAPETETPHQDFPEPPHFPGPPEPEEPEPEAEKTEAAEEEPAPAATEAPETAESAEQPAVPALVLEPESPPREEKPKVPELVLEGEELHRDEKPFVPELTLEPEPVITEEVPAEAEQIEEEVPPSEAEIQSIEETPAPLPESEAQSVEEAPAPEPVPVPAPKPRSYTGYKAPVLQNTRLPAGYTPAQGGHSSSPYDLEKDIRKATPYNSPAIALRENSPVAPRRTEQGRSVQTAAPAVKLRTNRAFWKLWLFGILTLGIYPLVVLCHVSKEINTVASDYDHRRTLHYLLACLLTLPTLGVYFFIWNTKLCNRMSSELRRRGIDYNFGAAHFWLLDVLGCFTLICPIIFTHKLMKAMNMINADYNSGQ